jgi:copper chaperone
MSTTREYVVEGMTCEHCRRAVTEEVSGVAGVENVDVDLASGRVAVTGEAFSDHAVEASVKEAGYEVVAS